MLQRLNTHRTALTGLAIGGGSIVASVAALFRLLSDPPYFDALVTAVMHSRAHTVTPVDVQTYASLGAASMAILGAIVVALLLSYFGRPATVPADTGATGAAQAPKSPP